MATFQATAQDSERRALISLRYERMRQKERRSWWWYNRLRTLIKSGEIEGNRAVQRYGELFGFGERTDYLKSIIREAKQA